MSTPRPKYHPHNQPGSGQERVTDEMRDRQARGSDPYHGIRPGQMLQMEDTTDKEKRGFATSVLDNHERLMMYAQSNEDSIASQRLRFMNSLCGFDDPADDYVVPAPVIEHRSKRKQNA